MDDSQTLPITFLTSLSTTIIIMILFNFPNSIMNTTELDVIILGNVFLGFALFSLIFTLLASIAVVCVFSIIIAPPTKNQLVELKDACIDYTRIFRELRIKRYEFDEDRMKSIFNYELNNAMKQMEQRFINQTKSSLSKANSMIMKQDAIIENLKTEVKVLKQDKKERDQLVNDKTLTQNTSENTKTVKKSNKLDFSIE